MITQKDLDALAATGLKAIVIDEKTDFSKLGEELGMGTVTGRATSTKSNLEEISRNPAGWFITFGFGSEWANHYYRLKSKDYLTARDEAFSTFGRNWAFMYPIEDLQDQIKRFGIKERVHAPNDNEGSEA